MINTLTLLLFWLVFFILVYFFPWLLEGIFLVFATSLPLLLFIGVIIALIVVYRACTMDPEVPSMAHKGVLDDSVDATEEFDIKSQQSVDHLDD